MYGELSGFNQNVPFPFRLDCAGDLIVEATLYDADASIAESLFVEFASLNNGPMISTYAYTILQGDVSRINIGPRGEILERFGNSNIVYLENMEDRELIINGTNMSVMNCETDSLFFVPYIGSPPEIAGLQFALHWPNGMSHAVAPPEPQYAVFTTESRYMLVPREIAERLSDLINRYGGVVEDFDEDSGVANQFSDCDAELVANLPDLVVAFADRGSVVQTPEDYLVIQRLERVCSFRFDIAAEAAVSVLQVNPFSLRMVNLRFESNRIYFCEPLFIS